MLPRPLRLSAQRDFARVFRKGMSVSTPYFFVRFLPSSLANPRVGVVVSNKISKKATIRNRIKRRLRAASYEERERIATPTDIVIISKPSIVTASYEEIHSQIVRAFSHPNTQPSKRP